uniref:Thaumatin-like protein n=1 Tax=Kalanchoe fedtschenkoi TaxID=63787 RepID=A0A7N0SVZ5_KALFE
MFIACGKEKGRCESGDCGGSLYCEGRGGQPPASLFEITVAADQDYYDVSLVDGYNLPMSVSVSRGCRWVGCVKDLNSICPGELRVWSGGRVVGCKSACMAFNTDWDCCRGAFGSPDTCKPTRYSRIFKGACPSAYSYAYDDKSSLATCNRGDYVLTFC